MLLAAATLVVGCSRHKGYIALTFDDGPSSTTMEILDVMEEFGARGSFFLIGSNINDSSAEAMQRAVAMGCEVENHSFTHPHMTELDSDARRDEVALTTAAITKYLEREPQFFRAPYIDEDDQLHRIIPLIFIGGYCPRDWDANVSVEERVEGLMANAADGQIFLLHDFEGNAATAETLRRVIPALQKEGYKFLTVSELFQQQKVSPRKGVRYDMVVKEE